MFTDPAPGIEWVYANIKQVVTHCSETPLKCCITGPAWTRKLALKGAAQFLLLTLSPEVLSYRNPSFALLQQTEGYSRKCCYQEAMLDSVLKCLEVLPAPSGFVWM